MALRLSILILCSTLLSSMMAHTETRVALVIGNNRYDNLPADKQLNRAVHDAQSVATALSAMDYHVILRTNASREQMLTALDEAIHSLDRGGSATIYFAGHGVGVNGTTLLIPSDAPSPNEAVEELLRRNSVSLDSLIDRLQDADARVNVIILDACRDNPYGWSSGRSRSLGAARGLERIGSLPKGFFVLYSAGDNQTALDSLPGDDADPDSIFTRMLLRHLPDKNLSLVGLAKSLQSEVSDLAARVGHEQVPAYYDELIGTPTITGEIGGLPFGSSQFGERAARNTVAPEAAEPPRGARHGTIEIDDKFAARRQLASAGMAWNQDTFETALKQEDYESINLYLQGGMKLSKAEIVLFTAPEGTTNLSFDPKTADLLVKYQAFDAKDGCGYDVRVALYGEILPKDSARADFVRRLCAAVGELTMPAPVAKVVSAARDAAGKAEQTIKLAREAEGLAKAAAAQADQAESKARSGAAGYKVLDNRPDFFYEGQVRGTTREGLGTIGYGYDNSSYRGQWRDNQFDGYGIWSRSAEQEFTGKFSHGQMQGPGLLAGRENVNEGVFDGFNFGRYGLHSVHAVQFDTGEFDGYSFKLGIRKNSDGSHFEGVWQYDDLKCGARFDSKGIIMSIETDCTTASLSQN